jgi:hypothetical protein
MEKKKKYYKKLFFHLLELSLWIAFILYQKSGGRKNALDFRVAVIEKMTAQHHREEFSSKVAGCPSTSTNPSRLTGRNFPSVIPATAKKQILLEYVECAAEFGMRRGRGPGGNHDICVKIVISLCVLFHVSEPFIQRRTYEDELM